MKLEDLDSLRYAQDCIRDAIDALAETETESAALVYELENMVSIIEDEASEEERERDIMMAEAYAEMRRDLELEYRMTR